MTDEPDWMNPANDRKTPYTEEELEVFVEGFIAGLEDDEWEIMKRKYGEKTARTLIKDGFRSQDENNQINLEPDETRH
jgi:hypothetical protein